MGTQSTSRCVRLCVNTAGGPCASLGLSLQALLEVYGRRVELCELGVVTGNACMLTYAPGAPARDRWNMYGRHAFLVAGAQSYGLSLRGLHPPEAVPAPRTPPEYELHFQDSYLPFVESALARDEPALAWMGWPRPQTAIWGVLTGVDAATKRCLGKTMFSKGRQIAQTASPVHVYLVQSYRDAQPDPRQLLADVLRRAAIVLNNQLDPAYGVLTGVACMERWHETLLGDPDVSDDAALSCDVHRQMVHTILMGRRAMTAFFDANRDIATATQADQMEAYASLFKEMIVHLKPFLDEEDLRLEVESEQDRAALASVAENVVDIERKAAAVGAESSDRP